MIQAFGEAIQFLRARPLSFVGMGIIILVQAGIALLQLPVASYFISTLDFGSLLEAFDAVQLIGFVLLSFIGMVLNFSAFLWVAQQVKIWKTRSTEKASLQLLKSSGLVTTAIILAGGLTLGVTGVLVSLLEVLGFMGVLLLGSMILLVIYFTIKFAFALPLMGFGMGLKQALQQSWRITQKHFFGAIAVLAGLFVVTTIIDLAVQYIIAQLDTELLAVPLNFISAVALTTFGAALLACAVPLQEIENITGMGKHAHARTAMK